MLRVVDRTTEAGQLRPSPVDRGVLRTLMASVQPTVTAADRLIPVAPDLARLIPFGGLRRGTVAEIAHHGLVCSTLSAAMAEGPWVAVVGVPSFGLAAAARLGVALERLAVVQSPPPEQAGSVVAALVDAVEVVVVGPGVITRATDARRLQARLRERSGVLLTTGPWPEATELQLHVVGGTWRGMEHGYGHLQEWTLEVEVRGRGAAAQGRRGLVRLAQPSRRNGTFAEVSEVVSELVSEPVSESLTPAATTILERVG